MLLVYLMSKVQRTRIPFGKIRIRVTESIDIWIWKANVVFYSKYEDCDLLIVYRKDINSVEVLIITKKSAPSHIALIVNSFSHTEVRQSTQIQYICVFNIVSHNRLGA